MGSGEVEGIEFTCPQCAESLAVNESMKTALLDRGCVICGASVTPAAFTDPSSDCS